MSTVGQHLNTTHYQSNLMSWVVSNAVLGAAFAEVVKRREHDSHNSDIWCLRRHWSVQKQALKSKIDIAPVYHRLPQRIRAHAILCFIALILRRVMRHRLKLAKSELSPEQALAHLRRIQRHSVSINRAAPMTGVSIVNTNRAKVLVALSRP